MEFIKKIGIVISLIALVGVGSAVSYNMIAEPSSPSLFTDVLSTFSVQNELAAEQQGFREINFEDPAIEAEFQEEIISNPGALAEQLEFLNELRNDSEQLSTQTTSEESESDETSFVDEVTTFFTGTDEPTLCLELKEAYAATQQSNTQAMLDLVRNNCSNTAQVAARGQFTNTGGERLLSQTGVSGFGQPVVSDVPGTGLNLGLFTIGEKKCVHCSLDKVVSEFLLDYKFKEDLLDATSSDDSRYDVRLKQYNDAVDKYNKAFEDCVKRTKLAYAVNSDNDKYPDVCPEAKPPCDACYDNYAINLARKTFQDLLAYPPYGRNHPDTKKALQDYKDALNNCDPGICVDDTVSNPAGGEKVTPVQPKPVEEDKCYDPEKDSALKKLLSEYDELLRAGKIDEMVNKGGEILKHLSEQPGKFKKGACPAYQAFYKKLDDKFTKDATPPAPMDTAEPTQLVNDEGKESAVRKQCEDCFDLGNFEGNWKYDDWKKQYITLLRAFISEHERNKRGVFSFSETESVTIKETEIQSIIEECAKSLSSCGDFGQLEYALIEKISKLKEAIINEYINEDKKNFQTTVAP